MVGRVLAHYGVPSAAEQARLEEIFPDGVCDWSGGDVGRT